jgi:hypothetical protein
MPSLRERIPEQISWEELIAHEPRLDDLLAEARSLKAGDGYCRETVWFWGEKSFKRRVCKLIGWDSPHLHTILATCEAYSLAYQTIRDALPPCRCPTCSIGADELSDAPQPISNDGADTPG